MKPEELNPKGTTISKGLGQPELPAPRLVRLHAFMSPKGYADPFDGYISRFGFVWWFWLPVLHIQKAEVLRGYANPFVARIVWLCFAVGIKVGREGTTNN